MKKSASQPLHLGHTLSDVAVLFRELAEAQGAPANHPPKRERSCAAEGAAREAQARALGKYLHDTLVAYAELDRDMERISGGRGSLATLGLALLQHQGLAKTRTHQTASSRLALLASVFETTDQQYKLARGITTVIVPLYGHKFEGAIEVKQYIPAKLVGASPGKWLVCPSTNLPPQIHQVLKFVMDAGQPIQIRMRWRGLEPVDVHKRDATDILWDASPWVVPENGHVGTVFVSPVLWPKKGRIATTMGVVVCPDSASPLTANYDIVIDLQENHDAGPVDQLPPEDIVIPDPDPTPDSHPLDVFTSLDPEGLRRSRDLTLDFLEDRVRVLDALVDEIGATTIFDTALMSQAIGFMKPTQARAFT